MITKERKPTVPYGTWVTFLLAPHIQGWRCRFRLVTGHAVKAQILPGMGDGRLHWGVVFPATDHLKEHRVGGHVDGTDAAALAEAKEAAERASQTGGRDYEPKG